MTDTLELIDLVARFAQTADGRDWKAARSLFQEEVLVDYSSLNGIPAAAVKADDLINSWKGFLPGFSRTQHLIGLPLITVSGDTAEVSAPVLAYHLIQNPAPADGGTWIVGGRYHWTLVRSAAGWKIAKLVLADPWQEGNPGLPELAQKRVGQK